MASLDIAAEPRRITRFLTELFGTADAGHLALWVLAPDRSSATAWFPVAALDRAAFHAAERSDAGDQVYFGVGLHPEPLGPARRGVEAGVSALPGLYADIDFGRSGHLAGTLPPTLDDALGLLAAVPVDPTILVRTGHGLHAYWLFPAVFAVETPDERAFLRGLNRRLQGALRAAAAAHGWTLDATADLARVLRPPGTVNRKPGCAPVLVRGLRVGGPRTATDELDELLPPLPEHGSRSRIATGSAPDSSSAEPEDANEASRPDFARIASACAYLRRWRDGAATLTEPEWHAGMSIAALCGDGERLAHEYSAPHPGYDRAETQRKFDRARAKDKPLSCRVIREERNGEADCSVCPLWGTISGPIVLGRPRTTLLWSGRNHPSDSTSTFAHCSDVRGDADDATAPPPFPVDIFPDEVAAFVEEGSAALGVPPDMIALPLLGFAAGVIGNSRALLVKPGWVERPNLWLGVVGTPGSGKSPALRLAQQPVSVLQRAAVEMWRLDLDRWEDAVAEAKARKEPPPERPNLEHFFTTDATLEALAAMLERSAGVAVVRDELVGWVHSHDAYRKAGDRQSYLSLWAGAALKVDRKGSGTLYVEHPVVPIVGGIQPELLPALAEEANRRDGFVDRIDMVWPLADPPGWTEAVVDPRQVEAVTDLFGLLRHRRRPGEDPAVAPLSDDGRRAFARWFDQNAELTKASGLAGGFAAKYPGKLARYVLVVAAMRYPDLPRRPIDAALVRDGIALVEYLRGHLGRILPAFAASASGEGAGLDARVVRVLGKTPGEWVQRRVLHEGLGGNVRAADLDAVLERLGAEGVVENRSVPTTGRHREESRLVLSSNEYMSKGPPEDPTDPLCSYVHMFGDSETDEKATAEPPTIPESCQFRFLCDVQGSCPGLWCAKEADGENGPTVRWEEAL